MIPLDCPLYLFFGLSISTDLISENYRIDWNSRYGYKSTFVNSQLRDRLVSLISLFCHPLLLICCSRCSVLHNSFTKRYSSCSRFLAEIKRFSIPSLFDSTTNDITQISNALYYMGLQVVTHCTYYGYLGHWKILGKSEYWLGSRS